MNTVKKIKDKMSREYGDFSGSFPEVAVSKRSTDGTVKLLLRYADGTAIESVIMPFRRRDTVCLSTQAGCAMGCTFCRTGASRLRRNLTSREILAQYLTCYQWIIDDRQKAHIPKPNIVFMGEGEPLHNFDAVKEACGLLLSRRGVSLGPRQITLSTCGYLPGLRRVRELGPVHIALSLHSALSHKRQKLIPLEKSSPLVEILPLLAKLPLRKNQFINFEYLLIQNFNDREEDAEALLELTSPFKAIVNIIPLNPAFGSPWKAPDEETVSRFKAMLVARDIRTMVRISRGRDIEAACGQLSGKELPGAQSPAGGSEPQD